jgi:hypothetical protein
MQAISGTFRVRLGGMLALKPPMPGRPFLGNALERHAHRRKRALDGFCIACDTTLCPWMRAIHLPDVRLEGVPLPQIPNEMNIPKRAASRMSMTYAKAWQAFSDDLLRCDIFRA